VYQGTTDGCSYDYIGCQRQTYSQGGVNAYRIFTLNACIALCDTEADCYGGSFDVNAANNNPSSFPCSLGTSTGYYDGQTSFNDGNIAFQVEKNSCTKSAAN
jgi:hypothetical protein